MCVCVFIAVERLAVAIQQVSAVADKHGAGIKLSVVYT